MELTQTLGLKLDDGCCDGLRDREVRGVNLAEGSTMAWDGLRGVLVCVVDVRAVALESTLGRLLEIFADSAIQNVWEFGRDIIKYRGIDTKVLGEDVLGSVSNPVIDHEGSSSIQSV